MYWPGGTWQRVRRTRLRKGVRVGWEDIWEWRGAGMGAGGCCWGVGEGGMPRAERMEVCFGWEGVEVVVFFCFVGGLGGGWSSFSLLRFWPLDFPRTARLCLSSSIKSALPSAMASPSLIHSSSCCGCMFFTAGALMRSVQGVGIRSLDWVELPITASNMIRAKQ